MKNKKMISLLPIKTERLIIRKTVTDDVDLLMKLDKQETTQKFLGGIKNKTREERVEFLYKKIKKFNSGIIGSLTVCLKDNDLPIGFLEFKIDENNNNAEVSYIFDFDYTRNGYCSECVKKLLEVGFKYLELSNIYADTIEGNISSQKILERLGFKLKSTRVVENGYIFLDYKILKEEYT